MSGALDLNDIQGNILAGFNTDFQVFVAFTMENGVGRDRVAPWLRTLADATTTVAEVRSQRRAMIEDRNQAPWIAVALGSRLLELCAAGLKIEKTFVQGMARRAASMLGDRTDVQHWQVGSSAAPVDLLLIVASNNEASAVAVAERVSAAGTDAGLRVSFRETGRRLDGEREHFGFRDGISQPRIAEYDSNADSFPGQFLFGHPIGPGGSIARPILDPRGIALNGSILTFRRLRQDVGAFHNFCRQEASRLQGQWPGLSGDWLAALLVGRWPSGALVSAEEGQDPGQLDEDFSFADDYDGKRCPLGAHIRKVNPRRGPSDEKEIPRLIRRGIPFGRPGEDDVGLLFVAYQTSPEQQLEFMTRSWMNSPTRPVLHAGHDMLVGVSTTNRSAEIRGPNGPVIVNDDSARWIISTGGAYLFAPGKQALRLLASSNH